MALFGGRKARGGGPTPARSVPLGRHLHSDEPEHVCVANFLSLLGSPSREQRPASWAGDPARAPTTVVGVALGDDIVHLAIWSEGGYQETRGYQEMALVIPGIAPDVPLPMVGHWKALDPSLKSIGWSRDVAFGTE